MLLGSNIIIYSFQSQFDFLQKLIKNKDTSCSAITQVETLGYYQISKDEKFYMEECFNAITVLPVTDTIINTATFLRQQKNISLGDAIIAATALEFQQTLVTRNVIDFEWVEGLKILNPFE